MNQISHEKSYKWRAWDLNPEPQEMKDGGRKRFLSA